MLKEQDRGNIFAGLRIPLVTSLAALGMASCASNPEKKLEEIIGGPLIRHVDSQAAKAPNGIEVNTAEKK